MRNLNRSNQELAWLLPIRLAVTYKGVLDSVRERLVGEPQVEGSNRQTILLVEDYKDSREMTRFLLESLEYRVLEARHGKEALELALREQPDLILTDFNLPDIDGLVLVRRLRKLSEELSRVPIIMLTAHDAYEFSDSIIDAGCTAFFTKPIDFASLEKIIKTLLKKSKEINGTVNDTCS